MKRPVRWLLAVGLGLVFAAVVAPALVSMVCRNVGLAHLHRGIMVSSGRQLDQGRMWLARSNAWRENAGAEVGLAMAYDALGKEQAAVEAIARAEELSPEDPLVPWVAGQLALHGGRAEQAVAYWQQARAGNYLVLAAGCDLKAGRLAEAQTTVELALKVDPDQAEGWLILGQLQQRRGEFEGAISAYQHALDLDPGLEDAYLGLARIYVEQGDTVQALAVLEEAVRQLPQAARAYAMAADTMRQAGRYTEALAWCERGQTAVPNHWTLDFCAGVVLWQLEEPERAIEQFRQAVRHGADECAMQYWIGISYRDLGQFELAVTALEDAKCGDANIPWVYVELARTYEQMGQIDLAVAEYNAFLTRFPEDEPLRKLVLEEIQRLMEIDEP